MKVKGPIFMRRFSVTPHANAVPVLEVVMQRVGAVAFATWFETLGEREVSLSERWRCIAPNMWQVMSQKK